MNKAEFEAAKQALYSKNRQIKATAVKAADFELLLSRLANLPYGQAKKIFDEEVLAMLEKYGYADR